MAPYNPYANLKKSKATMSTMATTKTLSSSSSSSSSAVSPPHMSGRVVAADPRRQKVTTDLCDAMNKTRRTTTATTTTTTTNMANTRMNKAMSTAAGTTKSLSSSMMVHAIHSNYSPSSSRPSMSMSLSPLRSSSAAKAATATATATATAKRKTTEENMTTIAMAAKKKYFRNSPETTTKTMTTGTVGKACVRGPSSFPLKKTAPKITTTTMSTSKTTGSTTERVTTEMNDATNTTAGETNKMMMAEKRYTSPVDCTRKTSMAAARMIIGATDPAARSSAKERTLKQLPRMEMAEKTPHDDSDAGDRIRRSGYEASTEGVTTGEAERTATVVGSSLPQPSSTTATATTKTKKETSASLASEVGGGNITLKSHLRKQISDLKRIKAIQKAEVIKRKRYQEKVLERQRRTEEINLIKKRMEEQRANERRKRELERLAEREKKEDERRKKEERRRLERIERERIRHERARETVVRMEIRKDVRTLLDEMVWTVESGCDAERRNECDKALGYIKNKIMVMHREERKMKARLEKARREEEEKKKVEQLMERERTMRFDQCTQQNPHTFLGPYGHFDYYHYDYYYGFANGHTNPSTLAAAAMKTTTTTTMVEPFLAPPPAQFYMPPGVPGPASASISSLLPDRRGAFDAVVDSTPKLLCGGDGDGGGDNAPPIVTTSTDDGRNQHGAPSSSDGNGDGNIGGAFVAADDDARTNATTTTATSTAALKMTETIVAPKVETEMEPMESSSSSASSHTASASGAAAAAVIASFAAASSSSCFSSSLPYSYASDRANASLLSPRFRIESATRGAAAPAASTEVCAGSSSSMMTTATTTMAAAPVWMAEEDVNADEEVNKKGEEEEEGEADDDSCRPSIVPSMLSSTTQTTRSSPEATLPSSSSDMDDFIFDVLRGTELSFDGGSEGDECHDEDEGEGEKDGVGATTSNHAGTASSVAANDTAYVESAVVDVAGYHAANGTVMGMGMGQKEDIPGASAVRPPSASLSLTRQVEATMPKEIEDAVVTEASSTSLSSSSISVRATIAGLGAVGRGGRNGPSLLPKTMTPSSSDLTNFSTYRHRDAVLSPAPKALEESESGIKYFEGGSGALITAAGTQVEGRGSEGGEEIGRRERVLSDGLAVVAPFLPTATISASSAVAATAPPSNSNDVPATSTMLPSSENMYLVPTPPFSSWPLHPLPFHHHNYHHRSHPTAPHIIPIYPPRFVAAAASSSFLPLTSSSASSITSAVPHYSHPLLHHAVADAAAASSDQLLYSSSPSMRVPAINSSLPNVDPLRCRSTIQPATYTPPPPIRPRPPSPPAVRTCPHPLLNPSPFAKTHVVLPMPVVIYGKCSSFASSSSSSFSFVFSSLSSSEIQRDTSFVIKVTLRTDSGLVDRDLLMADGKSVDWDKAMVVPCTTDEKKNETNEEEMVKEGGRKVSEVGTVAKKSQSPSTPPPVEERSMATAAVDIDTDAVGLSEADCATIVDVGGTLPPLPPNQERRRRRRRRCQFTVLAVVASEERNADRQGDDQVGEGKYDAADDDKNKIDGRKDDGTDAAAAATAAAASEGGSSAPSSPSLVLMPGDIILSVGGTSVAGMTFREARALFVGETIGGHFVTATASATAASTMSMTPHAAANSDAIRYELTVAREKSAMKNVVVSSSSPIANTNSASNKDERRGPGDGDPAMDDALAATSSEKVDGDSPPSSRDVAAVTGMSMAVATPSPPTLSPAIPAATATAVVNAPFVLDRSGSRVLLGEFTDVELRALVEAANACSSSSLSLNWIDGADGRECAAALYFRSVLSTRADLRETLARRDVSVLVTKWTYEASRIDDAAARKADSYWRDAWRDEGKEEQEVDQRKLCALRDGMHPSPNHLATGGALNPARRAELRARPRPTAGCKCGALDHVRVNDPRCVLYRDLRLLLGSEEIAPKEKIGDDNRAAAADGDERSGPTSSAIEYAYKERMRRVREERMRRVREEREADDREAAFVQDMERFQVSRQKMAVFAPGLLSVMVLSAVAFLNEEWGRSDLVLPGLGEEEGEGLLACGSDGDCSGKDSEDEEFDSESDGDDDVPLTSLRTIKHSESGRRGRRAVIPPLKRRKVVSDLSSIRCGEPSPYCLAAVLVHISRTWGHIYREPEHVEFAWQSKLRRGSQKRAPLYELYCANPQPPGALTFETLRFAIGEELLSRLKEASSISRSVNTVLIPQFAENGESRSKANVFSTFHNPDKLFGVTSDAQGLKGSDDVSAENTTASSPSQSPTSRGASSPDAAAAIRQTTMDDLVVAHLSSDGRTGLLREIRYLIQVGILGVFDDEKRGGGSYSRHLFLRTGWANKVGFSVLKDMQERGWSRDRDVEGRFCIHDSVRGGLSKTWKYVDEGWVRTDSPDVIVHRHEEYDLRRKIFEERYEAYRQRADGVGKFGI